MTTMKIKICGLTNSIDASAAVSAGATDLGFVMGGSVLPQEIEPHAQAVRLTIRSLGSSARTHLVTHLTNAKDIAELSEYIGCYGIQVSEPVDVSVLEELSLLTTKPIIKTIPTNDPNYLAVLTEYLPYCDEFLVDSTNAGYIGGTGKLNNLVRCAEIAALSPLPVWLAGGLTPDNVANSLRATGADFADVSTGVSCYSSEFPRKDRKDPEKIARFITNARSAYVES